MDTIKQERHEQFQECLQHVARYFELDSNIIMTNRSEEYTTARYIIIRAMCDLYSDGEISKISGLTRSGVNTIKNKFNIRFNTTHMINLYNKLQTQIKSYFQV